MQKQIVTIALISLILLSLLVFIGVPFVQAKNDKDDKDEKLIRVIIDTVGPPKNEHEDDVKELGGKVKYKYKLIEAMAVSIPESKLEKLLEKLQDKPWVKRVSLDREVHALLDVSVPTIEALGVWKGGCKGFGIKIAICDTGIDKYHPDLVGKVVYENMFLSSIWGMFEGPEDNNGHGTHVAGIAAGKGSVYRGVAPEASLINAKCLDMFGSGYLSDVIAAIDWSVDVGADVISRSIGAPGPCDGTCDLCMAVDNAVVYRGVVVVVAAGNSGPDTGTITCPGNAEEAITVGATDDHGTSSMADDTITEWSGRGPTADGRIKPDVVAPGVNIMSCDYSTNAYISMSGTSMATPHVSGAAALLLCARPDLTPAEVKAALKNSAIDLGSYGVNTQGAGEINVYAAYQQITGGLSVQVDVTPTQVDMGNAFDVHAKITNNEIVTAVRVVATIYLPEGLNLLSGEGNVGDLGSGLSGYGSWKVQADIPGSYTITVSAIDATTLTGEGTASVKVLTLPSIDVTELTSPNVVYAGDMFTLKATIKNNGEGKATGVVASIILPQGLSVVPAGDTERHVGDLIGGSSQTVTWNVMAEAIGSYAITVQAWSNNGGGISRSKTIEVQEKPATPTATVYMDLSKRSLWKLLWRVTATVTVTLDGINAITGARVDCEWGGVYGYRAVYGITDKNGKVSFRTDWIMASGMVSFKVDRVMKDGQEYDLAGVLIGYIAGP